MTGAPAKRRSRWLRRTLPLLGPAFVASIAYVDPGNFATNTVAGATYGDLLIWVVVSANLMAMFVQSLAARLGLATGKGLAAVCRERFGRKTTLGLWFQAELIAMATDLAEIVGAAVALHLLFGMPALPAGLVAAVVATAILELERRGHRRFEVVIIGMLAVILIGFLYSAFASGGSPGDAIGGLVPGFDGSESVLLAVGILGATVMPHVIYLHSSLVARRPDGRDRESILRRLKATRTDIVVALGIAGSINLAMLWVAATLLHSPGASDSGSRYTLETAHAAYDATAGQATALAFALALLVSGFASASVGTFAGQVVMEEFTERRIPILLRRMITIAPALIVLALGIDPTQALVVSQVILSFGIPFALVPLIRFTSDGELMGEWRLSGRLTAVAVAIAGLISCLNAVLVVLAFS